MWSVIGFDPATVLPRFINALPTRFEVGEGPVIFNASQIDIDPATGRALAIERIQRSSRSERDGRDRGAGTPGRADGRAGRADSPSTSTPTRSAPTAS